MEVGEERGLCMEHRREVSHTELLIHAPREVQEEAFQVRMVTEGRIDFLLPCRLQYVDGRQLFCYDTTSRQPLASLHEHRFYSFEDLRQLYEQLILALGKLEEYLLEADQLVLLPECIFCEGGGQKLFFCLLPGYHKDLAASLCSLSEDLLPRLDHKDSRAVAFGYGCFREAMEKEVRLEAWERLLARLSREEGAVEEGKLDRKEKEKRAVSHGSHSAFTSSGTQGGTEYMESLPSSLYWEETGEEERKGRRLLSGLVGVFLALLCLLAFIFLRLYGYLPDFSAEQIAGVVLVLLALGSGLWFWSEKREPKVLPGQKGLRLIVQGERQQEGRQKKTAASVKEGELPAVYELYEDKTEFSGFVQYEEPEGAEVTQLLKHEEERPRLHPLLEDEEAKDFFLERETMVVGKLEGSCDLVIHHPAVSRMHAQIRKEEGRCYLTDLNSRNGTFVNDRLLVSGQKTLLREGDLVRFADESYVYMETKKEDWPN